MKTAIQIAKIRAVVLYIMQSFTQGVDYIKLFKILYFAQQDHLVKYGKVIVEDSFRALKHGPVPAYTYKALQIAEGKPLDGNFDEFLSDIEVRDKKVYTSAVPDIFFKQKTAYGMPKWLEFRRVLFRSKVVPVIGYMTFEEAIEYVSNGYKSLIADRKSVV